MHADSIVQRFIRTQLWEMHASRQEPLAQSVCALMGGHKLSLTRLARATMGSKTMKSALKRVDRQIGSPQVLRESSLAAAAISGQLCANNAMRELVVAVDWSAVAPGGEFAELRAVVTNAEMGRGIVLYQEVYPRAQQGSQQAEGDLLRRLKSCIPKTAKVIIVSDAGFRQPWFEQVQSLGWNWIGRVRGNAQVRQHAGSWRGLTHWRESARRRAHRHSDCELTREHRLSCDLVVVKTRPKDRKIYARAGYGVNSTAARYARAGAQEPWVLAHSKELSERFRAQEIVALYAQRMQIEENFRDTKSTYFGMGLEMARSRSALRLQGLLLIHTLAMFFLWHIGQLAEAEGLHRRFRSTTRTRREISIIALALLLCVQRNIELSPHAQLCLATRLGIRS